MGKETLQEMLSPQVQESPGDSTIFYGFGFMIQTRSSRGKVISHTGGWPGYGTLIERWPDINETLIMLSNNDHFTP